MDGIHDMGAMAGFGPIPVDDVEHGPGWGARLQVVALLSGGIRREGLEALPPEVYLSTGYHEKWLLCAEQRLGDSGVLDGDAYRRWQDLFTSDRDASPPIVTDESEARRIGARVTSTPLLADATAPRFAVGDRVCVARMRPERHHRCPRYVRGAVGVVESVPGSDRVPHLEWRENVFENVYTVVFDSTDLWGDRTEDGEPPYDLVIDLLESYLEPV